MQFTLSEYKYRVAVVYILGLFIQIVDGTIINVAVPTLADEFGVESTDIDWVIIGFFLAVALAIPVAGWLGDRFGTKRMFLIALIGFVAASALCGLAQSVDQLVAFRILQGLFSGLIAPIGSAMLLRAFPMSERATSSALIIGVVVVAPAIGPVAGGAILRFLNWRWIFYINIPIGAVAVFLGVTWLREEVAGAKGRIDWWGLALSGSALALILFGVSEAPARGWDSAVILGALVGGVLLFVAMIFVELRVEDPVVALRLFKDRLFRANNLAMSPAYAAFFGMIFLLPVFLQKVVEEDALTTGLVMAPQPIGVILSSQILGRRLYRRVGPRPMMFWGMVLAFLSSLWFITVDETTSLSSISVALLIRGFGMGFVFLATQTATYATIELPRMGRATSLFNMQRQASVAAGTALSATLLAALVTSVDSPADGGSSTLERVDAFQVAFLVSALLFVLAAAASLLVRNEDAAETMGPQGASAPRPAAQKR